MTENAVFAREAEGARAASSTAPPSLRRSRLARSFLFKVLTLLGNNLNFL